MDTFVQIRGQFQSVAGVVMHGHRVASGDTADSPYPAGTISMQVPFFAERGLDLSAFYPATLNIDIQPLRFRLVQPRWHFKTVVWTNLHPPETFSFVTCSLIFAQQRYEGWIYYPHPETKQAHFQHPSVLEVLMPRITGIEYGSQVELWLDPREIEVFR